MITIFVGPRKTGTSWLHAFLFGSLVDKEIRFPARFFRNWAYDHYVATREVLIWPYLLHDRRSLRSLLEMLDERGRAYRLVTTERESRFRNRSQIEFLMRYGTRRSSARRATIVDERCWRANLSWLKTRAAVQSLNIVDACEEDIAYLSQLSGRSDQDVRGALKRKVYLTDEQAKLPVRTLARLFFVSKPFLPRALRSLPHQAAARRLLYRPAG